jgi:hypothetical protein
MMRRSCNSLTSLTSLTSINSRTKIFNNRDFQKYIVNMEEDIIKIINDYYYYTDKYDRRLINIIDRFDCKSNKLYIDLRNRENDYKRLNKKVDYLYNYLKMCYNAPIKKIDVGIGDTSDTSDDEYTCRYMLVFLKVYTFFVIGMLINYGF